MAYSNCTAILTHDFNSCGYRIHWYEYGVYFMAVSLLVHFEDKRNCIALLFCL